MLIHLPILPPGSFLGYAWPVKQAGIPTTPQPQGGWGEAGDQGAAPLPREPCVPRCTGQEAPALWWAPQARVAEAAARHHLW